MRALVVGVNHRTAPVELREKLAIPADRYGDYLRKLKGSFPRCEALVLSTCNRVELYVARELHGEPRINDLLAWVAGQYTIPSDQLLTSIYHLDGEEAIRHIFRVVTSLDSLVVGESQILGQAKEALEVAAASGATGAFLRALFERSFSAAKQIRSETAIAEGHVSVGSVAIDFINQVFDSVQDKTVLVVGAGKMGRLALRHLSRQKPGRVLVTNRTASRAAAIAEEVGGQVAGYERMKDNLTQADIVITSVGGDEPIFTPATFEGVIAARRYRPLLIIDIAVPRNVDPSVAELQNVYLYNVDDLEAAVAQTVAARRQELCRCEDLLEKHIQAFLAWQGTRKVGPTIKAFRGKLDEIAQAETAWLMSRLEGADENQKALLKQFVHRLVGKVFHGPASKLTEEARDGTGHVRARSLAELFDLDVADE